ncbi:MAG: oxidoreductase [Parvibaculum sp.]|uniref:oxidoreductase n=1 Tax=Parvibaculum sp. TaxID=2024848 RepID=UPI00284867C9|nr:oxidoreductase [Parvibaculum sp.]MDR3498422.1 oxidoreductase [Parvibaculum sp.]
MSATNRITSPFGRTSTALEVIKGHDLTGKTVLITGAASGIGVETARAFASAGADVTLAVRDTGKGEAVAADLRKSTGNKNIAVGALDLGDLASVRKFAADFAKRHAALNILVNNAGIMATPEGKTKDGFELQFGTNHLGHFLLANLLMPQLLKGAPARVVSLSSIGHRRSPVVFDDVNFKNRPYDKWNAYGQSKTANALFAVGLTKRFRDKGVLANAVMPGGIMTGLQKHMPIEEQKALGWILPDGSTNPGMKTPAQGAATSVWAATGKELEGVGGLYLEDCAEAVAWKEDQPWTGVLPYALDPKAADELWTLSERMVGLA